MVTKFLSLDTDATLSANSDYIVPSQKAIKTALDTKLTTPANGVAGQLLSLVDDNPAWKDIIVILTGTNKPNDTTVAIGDKYVDPATNTIYECTALPEHVTLTVNTDPADATVTFDVDTSTSTGAATYISLGTYLPNRIYYFADTGICGFWDGTQIVEISSSGASGDSVFKVSGTIASDTTTIALNHALSDVAQVLYVNLDMAIALPSAYTLDATGANIVFTETLTAGTNYAVLYTTTLSGIEAIPTQQIYSVSSTTTQETSVLDIGVEITKDSIVSVNLGNTILLHDLYTTSGTTVVLQEAVPAGLMWNVRYIRGVVLGANTVTTDTAQTISGAKSFTGATTAPTVAITDNSLNVVNTAYINAKFKRVTAMPETPEEGVFYFVTG